MFRRFPQTTHHRPRWRTLAAGLAAVAAIAGTLLVLHSSAASSASAHGQTRIGAVADVISSTGDGDPSLYTNTAGVYIAGDPVDVMGNYTLCVPSEAWCPQSPYVPNHSGWIEDCPTAGEPDACGYVFDQATSNQIVRYAAAGTAGAVGTAISPVCGPAAPLCVGASAMIAQAISDNQNYLPNGRCLYLHLVDDADVANWINFGANSTTPVGVRIIDCP